ncbi:type IV pili twitching motility protein PilT, partial [bacterium]
MAHPIDDLLREMVAQDASDLHLKAGRPPKVRVRGELTDLGPAAVDPATHNRRLLEILNDERCERLYAHKECDLSYSVEGLARFRVNMFWQRGHIGAVFRLIPFEIRTIDELGLPPITKSIAM